MKILICHRPGGAFGFITDGWINALRDRGHIVQRYDNNLNSWNAFKPDLYIGASGHKQNIPTKRTARVALHVNPYGPINIPGINESQESIKWVIDQKPDAVFGYGSEEDRLLWSYWKDRHNIKWVPMPTAGDKTIFKNLNKERVYDIVYLGGRWPYKALTIDEYLLPVIRSSKSFKLHGWGDWPSNICSGILADDEANGFLNSGKIGPCLSEKHTQEYGIDIPERAFKLALCGTLFIHDSVIQMRNMIKSAIIASSPSHFHDLCEYYSKEEHKQEREEIATQQHIEVMENHTYHHRISLLLKTIGYDTESLLMLQ